MHYLLKNMDRLTCHLATCVIPEGEGVKRTLLREKITKKSLAVILNGNINGIDLDYFRRSADVKIKAAALRKKAFTFCYVGRMTRDKGINELIRAFAELSETFPEVHLVLVGPLEQELDPISETALELIQNHPAITFTGFQEDVRPFLAASDAFVFPSYREGFPNVVIQAGAMGLPSIVTDINGSNEIIIQGQNGIIIPPKDQHTLLDAMMYFAEHQDIVTTMAASCRPLIASRYEQKMVWEAILRMYQSLDNEK
jgi:glycosyltransferase involved in cell wall biosynthesis